MASGTSDADFVHHGAAPRDTPAAADRAYAPAVDGLRAVAALLILLIHLGVWTGATVDAATGEETWLGTAVGHTRVGVQIFFVISGYLLYRAWAGAALDGRARPRARVYYWHRFLRIVPAYWVLLLVVLLAWHRDLFGAGWRTVRIVTLQHTFTTYDLPPGWNPLVQIWSLVTEVHFYLLLPLLALVLDRLLRVARRGTALAFGLLGLLGAVSIAWVWLLYDLVPAPETQARNVWLPAFFLCFCAGMAMALLRARAERGALPSAPERFAVRRPWTCWGVALAAYVLITVGKQEWFGPPHAAGGQPGTGEALFNSLLLAFIAWALTAPVLLAPGSGPHRLLARPAMAWLGRISYGIFLWHIAVMHVVIQEVLGESVGTLGMAGFWVLLPVTTAVTVLVAWLSYVLVEAPLRRRFRAAPRP
ncbi:acyltransferase family protein [Streptomyces boncukensis]|uniref:Acyltransferase n=1 Tax=Streptomyces boncukensis TaxID=2711219 RepID=A0A6G4X5I9_9ACTN|nr:acyltransferase [Streptomyces boncukensis]NGO72117.1 acyltransferase [Streptomyces boncukensis]